MLPVVVMAIRREASSIGGDHAALSSLVSKDHSSFSHIGVHKSIRATQALIFLSSDPTQLIAY